VSAEIEGLRVAAAVPCYNAASTIANCISSLNAQTRKPDQIIVADDGSTDGSAIVAAYAGAEVISTGQNVGLSAARNLLWRHSDADIIVFLDADTVAHDDLIERLLQHYDGEDVAGVGGQAVEARIDNIYDLWRKFTAAQTLGDELIQDSEVLFGLCCSYRRSALERVSGFDPFFSSNGEDHDISTRLRLANYRLVYDPAAIVDHHKTDSFRSLMQTLYRYELFTQIAKLRSGVQIESHYRTFWRRIGFVFDRLWQILRTRRGLKFALIDLAALVPIFSACRTAKRIARRVRQKVGPQKDKRPFSD
jgi:GT2 family glycosyltransferase